MHTLENDQLCVTISDHGAELSGIFDKKNDREILWNADPSHWKRHAPVLFPNVGRYYEDHCLINGKTYRIRLHIYWNPRMRQRKHGHMSFSCILHIRWKVVI